MTLRRTAVGLCFGTAVALAAAACSGSSGTTATSAPSPVDTQSSADTGGAGGASGSSSPAGTGSTDNTGASDTTGATDTTAGSGNTDGASASSATGGSQSSSAPIGPVVDGGTFTVSIPADPGNLDPQGSAGTINFQMARFGYDYLLNQDADGKLQSGVAASWKVSGPKITFTMEKGVTCADGSPFTAADAAANIDYVGDPKNKSPLLGAYLPAGAKATADAAGTVTVTTPKIAPFVLQGLANLPMVCAKGMANRKSLAQATSGSGPYQLSEAVPGDHYTYQKRDGYTWGPGGAATATPGLPATVIFKVVANETTAANLLLSGGLSAATVIGPDSARLEAAKLFSAGAEGVTGEMWFNHASNKPGADPAVRKALTSALDLTQLAKVLTAGRGGPGTTFSTVAPVACPGNSVGPALPAHDLAAAGQELDAAGWTKAGDFRAKKGVPLAVTFIYTTALGTGGSAAAELAAQVWKQLGVQVTVKPQDDTAIQTTVFSTGDWDIAWLPLNVNSPDQAVGFLSGPVPPDGTNFAHVDNAAYNSLVAKASAVAGTAGCTDWLAAESEIVKAADVIPFANLTTKVYGKNTHFELAGAIVPTSIRMLAG